MFSLFKVILLSLFSYSAYALSADNFPSQFAIKKFECKMQCFELQRQDTGAQMGVLVPSTKHKGTFLFKDAQAEPQVIIQFIGLYADARVFNLYSSQGEFLGRTYVQGNPILGSSLYTTDLYEVDGTTWKATIQSNVAGTSHGVYEGRWWWGKQALATLSRPLFTLQTDSEVLVTNPQKLFSLMEPNLFAALSAMHCINNASLFIYPQFKALQAKVRKLTLSSLGSKKPANLSQLQAIASLLNSRFQEQYQSIVLDAEDMNRAFVHFACDLIQSHALNADEENIAIQYLKKMMNV